MERKISGTIEMARRGRDGTTEHVVWHEDHFPIMYRADCWCEPRHIFVENPEIGDEKLEGIYYVVLHAGPAHRPYFPPRDITERLYSDLNDPPEGGWDSVMASESVDRLLKDIGKDGYVRKAKKLKQGKDETIEDFYNRLKQEIDKGVAELDYETDDPEALNDLLERDDDFELEIDEEE